ncbi:hypothetical protein D7D52_22670 [Nocardia yunnanensis]|uniref:Terpene synthase n=1 Tax=Nocardia yunnanensis TaxID=2382165 RepID=A0A386ZHX5_9NOCA|nr:family 2 encapsulin nanocompartment cargo protein terpene cyclase [Nocardia yunnanensis]AYF76175.1 hypothetical protein D7D52_22670 [Nocardia yunnanensis]
MSVLSRAAAPPAASEVAAAVAALLTNLDTTAPAVLGAPAASGPADDPRLGIAAAAHSPRRLLGPSGLGAPSLAIDLPNPRAIAELAGQASRPPSPVGGAMPIRHRPPSSAGAPTGPGAARRFANGPTGIGTASASRPGGIPVRSAPVTSAPPRGEIGATRPGTSGSAIPTLYCPPPVRDDPALAATVNAGIIAWAERIGLYEGRLEELHRADFGRLIMLAHPDCDDADRLLAVAKCAVSEWSVDDYYCEEDASDLAPDGSRSSPEAELGPRLELAAAAMDPVHLPPRYQVRVEQAMQADPILRAFRTSFEHLSHFATPAQVARLRSEIAGWFIALGAEAGWRQAGRMPPVWEYLLNRQPHSFLPCMAPIDAVGGYELPAAEYTDPRVRRVVTTAALAAQMVNDLYSMAREDLSNGREFNLPTVLAAEENCSRRAAVQATAEVHDELVHRFEAEAGLLAASGSPQLRRFLTGLWSWMGGNRAWHADSRRYRDDS